LDEKGREILRKDESFGEFWRKVGVWTRKNGHGFGVSAWAVVSYGFSDGVFRRRAGGESVKSEKGRGGHAVGRAMRAPLQGGRGACLCALLGQNSGGERAYVPVAQGRKKSGVCLGLRAGRVLLARSRRETREEPGRGRGGMSLRLMRRWDGRALPKTSA
jgi:hypothetical protein